MFENPMFLISLGSGILYALLFHYIGHKKFKLDYMQSMWLPAATFLVSSGFAIYLLTMDNYGWQMLSAMIIVMLNGYFIMGYAITILIYRYLIK